MLIVRQAVDFLLAHKDLVSLALQAILLFVAFALIRMAAAQATAANLQAKAALQQVRAADGQAEAAHILTESVKQQLKIIVVQLEKAKSQLEEEAGKQTLAIQPNLKLRDADPGFETSPVMMKNEGPGVAYRINWRFVAPTNAALSNRVCEVGILQVGQEIAIPWGFDKDYPRLQSRLLDENGIRIECMDAKGRLYATTARMNQQKQIILENEQVLPEIASPARTT
jgi:hypothetical protein